MSYVYNMTEGVTLEFTLRSNGTKRTVAFGERYFVNATAPVDIKITCDPSYVIYAMRTEPDHFTVGFLRGSVQTVSRSNITFPYDVNIYVDLVHADKIRHIRYLERNVEVIFYDTIKEKEFVIARANDYIEDSNYNSLVVAKEGYYLVNVSTYLDGELLSYVISGDGKTATLNNIDVTENLTIDIEITDEEPNAVPKHNVSYDNQYVDVDFNGVSIPSGITSLDEGDYTVTINAIEGYLITSVGMFVDGEYVSFNVSVDGKSVDLVLTLDGDIHLIIETEIEPPPIVYHEITNEHDNVDIMFNDLLLTVGVNVLEEQNYSVIVHAQEGFLINSVGGYLQGEWIHFTISEDKMSASTNIFLNSDFNFSISTIIEQPPQDVTGFNHLYLVDGEKLKQLASERFGRGADDTVTDLGDYIINVVELPFPITNEIKGLETQIMLAFELISTTAIELLSDAMILNVGSIEVPQTYNNSYDFMNTDVVLHLPFSDSIQLDVNYVVGQTIEIYYVIDLYNGDATINIKSSKIDGQVFHNESTRIGKPIPFIRTGDNKILGDASTNIIHNQVYNAFLEVIRNEPYEVNNIFNSDTSIHSKLINEYGYVTVNNIVLNTNATLEEKNTINSLLRNGVYIK